VPLGRRFMPPPDKGSKPRRRCRTSRSHRGRRRHRTPSRRQWGRVALTPGRRGAEDTTNDVDLPWASTTPVLTITTGPDNETYHMYVRSRDGALIIGSRSNFIVLSQSNASDLASAFASFASTGTYT
jgi:hypothetical protein